jgi:hypothetical protein
LNVEPVRRPARSITRAQSLRDNPLQPHLAGVLEHDGAFRMLQVLIQAHAVPSLLQDARQRGLANLDRLSPKVRPVRGRLSSGCLARPDSLRAIANGLRLIWVCRLSASVCAARCSLFFARHPSLRADAAFGVRPRLYQIGPVLRELICRIPPPSLGHRPILIRPREGRVRSPYRVACNATTHQAIPRPFFPAGHPRDSGNGPRASAG